jgi:iron complex outermembrane recepter protein
MPIALHLRCTVATMAIVGCATLPVWAEEVDNAVLRARDAFGERIGVEQVGLYNEQQVRGFSLGDTASYRIDGLYVLREFQFPDTLLAGVTVKVGVSSARLDYPSPSGVVDYRLKDAKPGARELNVNFGIRDFGTRFVEFAGAYSPEHGKWGIAGGVQTLPDVRYPNGTGGHNHGFGFVPVWRPNDQVRVRTVFSGDRSTYNGDYIVLSALPNTLPPKTKGQNLSLRGARVLRYSYNTGALVDIELSRRWAFAGTVFYSDTERSPQDFSLVALRPDRTADITLNPTEGRHNWALTGGGVLKYAFENESATHELSAAVRGRQSADQNRSLPPVRLLNVDITREPYPARPATPGPVSSVISDVDQVIGSLGYAGNYFDRLELRGGVHRTRYTKNVTAANGSVAKRVDNTWIYNASAVFAATADLTLFANTVKGVEESGVAPQNAINRSEVLPQVTAEQFEVGARYALTPKLSFSLAGFDTTKLTPGLRPDGVFTLVGEVNHRGAEVSLAGEIADGTTVVVGGMAMKPRLSGTLVDTGVIGRKPAAISSTVGIASIDHRLSWAPGWSVDARVTWTGSREANTANTLHVPGYAQFGVGGRYGFNWAGRPMLLRFAVSNLFTNRPYLVAPGATYSQSPGTTGRISLRIGLAGS